MQMDVCGYGDLEKNFLRVLGGICFKTSERILKRFV